MQDQEILELEALLQQLDIMLQPILEQKNQDQLHDQIEPIDSVKLNSALGFVLNSLYFNYLKLNQIPTQNHQINQEIQRIKQYFQKIQALEKNPKFEQQNPNKIDQEASKRIIKANTDQDIWSDQQQKSQLHKATPMPQQHHLNWRSKIDKILK